VLGRAGLVFSVVVVVAVALGGATITRHRAVLDSSERSESSESSPSSPCVLVAAVTARRRSLSVAAIMPTRWRLSGGRFCCCPIPVVDRESFKQGCLVLSKLPVSSSLPPLASLAAASNDVLHRIALASKERKRRRTPRAPDEIACFRRRAGHHRPGTGGRTTHCDDDR
jgi:hypothetical protein